MKTKKVSNSRFTLVLEQIAIFGVAFDEARDIGALRHDFQFFGARPGQRSADE